MRWQRLLKTADPELDVIDQNAVPAHFDYHIPLMSLPLAFGTMVETIPDPGPYLVADKNPTLAHPDRHTGFQDRHRLARQ